MTYGALFSTQLVRDGRYAEAIETASREIATQPDEPEAFFNRGQALTLLGRFDEAVADYERALTLDDSASAVDPESIDDELFFALRSAAEARKADPAEAIGTLERYRQILPHGRHVDDIAKWRDSFNGVETVWVRERV
ncbi:MAG TPA: tetratricopeptide repeat protein [Polyangia bacterium]|jgi:tetratricopeptide (TPR) repeat protein|nr:tetratricopeptide repeat protein [Polyangia bacterium]